MRAKAKYFTRLEIASQDAFTITHRKGYVFRKDCCIEVKNVFIPLDYQLRESDLASHYSIWVKDNRIYHVPMENKKDSASGITYYLNQSEVVENFKDKDYGALFMQMGTGKTKTIIDIYKSKNITNPIIYITPASLLESTKKEVAKWCNDLNITYYSSESIGSSDTAYLDFSKRVAGSFLIVDESIKFKNLESKRVKRLLKFSHLAKYRFILNGTPVTRGVLDLLSQMDILDKSIFNMKESTFANVFLEYELGTKEKAPWRRWSRPHNEQHLIERISPYVAEMLLDFDKDCTFNSYDFYLNSVEAQDYNAHKHAYFQGKFEVKFLEMAQSFQRKYTICDDKMRFIKSWDKPKTIFFIKFLQWVEPLVEVLETKGRVGIYTGEIKDDLEGLDYLIVSYGCGSFGLNLQEYQNIVFVDTTFDYGQMVQAISRIKRLGQENNISITSLYVQTGLEKIIRKSIEKKDGTAKNIEKLLKEKTLKELEETL